MTTKTVQTTQYDRAAELTAQIEEARETLRLLEESPRWKPQPGELPLWDRAIDIMSQPQTDTDRAAKIAAFKQALQPLENELQALVAQKEAVALAAKRQAVRATLQAFADAANKLNRELEGIYSEMSAIGADNDTRLLMLAGTPQSNMGLIQGGMWIAECTVKPSGILEIVSKGVR